VSNATDWQSKNGVPAAIWIDGKKIVCTILWLTKTHIELIVSDPLKFSEGKRSALLVRDFLSFPMRVCSNFGYHAVLRFDQPLHRSIVELVTGQLIEARLAGMRDAIEERDIPFPIYSDFEAPLEGAESIAA